MMAKYEDLDESSKTRNFDYGCSKVEPPSRRNEQPPPFKLCT